MVKNILIAVLIVAVIALAAIAFTQFNAQQDATARVREAQTAQAAEIAAQTTSAARADAALLAQQTAEAGQAAAVELATDAARMQAAADADRVTAVAQAEDAAAAQAESESVLATVQAQATAQRLEQAAGDAELATARVLLAAQATDLAGAGSALATATAQVDLADFARVAAEQDRAAALAQAYAAATALARAQATIGAFQPASATLPPPTATAAPPTAASAATVMPTAAATGTPVAAGGVVLDQAFASTDGSISLSYPQGWLVQDVDGQIVMVNTMEALSGSGNQVQPGHFIANIIIGPATQLPGLTPEATVMEFLSALREIVNARAAASSQLSEPVALTIGPFSGARSEVSTADGHTLVIALALGEGTFAVGFGNSAPGELDQYEPVFRAVLGTLQYTPPAS